MAEVQRLHRHHQAGEIRGLAAALQEKGKRVSVLSSQVTQLAMVAEELRRQVAQFIDLADLEKIISRELPAKRTRLRSVASGQG